MVTRNDIKKAAVDLGIREGDIIIIHSSFKSLGEVENGAETVVGGFTDALGNDGTLVFPTLCQQDWENVYKNWHLDAVSDVGYLTNYFRKLPDAKRSDQATHSVAAIGKYRDYLTETHGQSGLRYGIFGDSPFSADSPWEKMYELGAKVVFLGVNIRKCTFRHYAEYCFIDKCLKKLEGHPEYEAMKARLWCYDRWNEKGVWPHINNEYVKPLLDKDGKITYTKCGNAEIMCVSSTEFVDLCTNLLESDDYDAIGGAEIMKAWMDDYYRITK